jgi:hypothetical protein
VQFGLQPIAFANERAPPHAHEFADQAGHLSRLVQVDVAAVAAVGSRSIVHIPCPFEKKALYELTFWTTPSLTSKGPPSEPSAQERQHRNNAEDEEEELRHSRKRARDYSARRSMQC